jgi:hypothetical protein
MDFSVSPERSLDRVDDDEEQGSGVHNIQRPQRTTFDAGSYTRVFYHGSYLPGKRCHFFCARTGVDINW